MKMWLLLLVWMAACLPAFAQLTISSRSQQGVTILDLSGPLTRQTAPLLGNAVRATRDQKVTRLAINFASVTTLDTAAQGALMFAFSDYREAGRMVWFRLRPNHREALLVTGLLGVVPFYASEDEAVASFR